MQFSYTARTSLAWNDQAAWTVSGTGVGAASFPGAGDTALVTGGGTFTLTAGALSTTVRNVTFDDASATLAVIGGLGTNGGLRVVDTLTLSAGSVTVMGGTGPADQGLQVLTLAGTGGTIDDYGYLSATTTTAAARLVVHDGAVLDVGAANGAAVLSYTEGTAGTIRLKATGTSYAGEIDGYGYRQTLSLSGIRPTRTTSAVWSGDTITVMSGGRVVYTLTGVRNVAPPGATQALTVGSNGFNLLLTAQCFLAGTRILTAEGLVAVERLRAGDRVRTAAGGERKVVRTGRRRIAAGAPGADALRPVRIAAHAFADGTPARDVWLSPDHAVFANGHLVPVKYLIDGGLIAVDRAIEVIEYHHFELELHDVVLADGLPAESLLDWAAHPMLAEVPVARGDAHWVGAGRVREAGACAPVAVCGPVIDAVRAGLAARARARRRAA